MASSPQTLENSSPDLSGSRSLEIPPFSPSSFAYNARVAVALGPCAAILLDLGGAPVIATFTLGLMIACFADLIGFRSGGFLKVLGPLIAALIPLFVRSFLYLPFPLAAWAAFLCTLTTFLIGVWASLQFQWIQIQNLPTVIALERLLFAFVPFTASSILTWATVSAVGGMINTSYCLMAFNCVFYWLFAIPRASSFNLHHGDESFIVRPLDSLILTMNLLFSPLLFHIASHYSVTFSSPTAASDLYLLFFVPFLFMWYASSRGTLWWFTTDPMQLDLFQMSNGLIGMAVIVICLEIRVLFHYSEREIQVPLEANVVLALIMLLGAVAGLGCFAVTLLCDDEFGFLDLFTALAVTNSLLVETFVGLPILSIALPAVAYLSLGLFITKKSVSSDLDFSELKYIAVSALFSLMVWFVTHNYWDLCIWFTGKANIVLVLAIPGSTILPGGRLHFLAEAGLIIHALFLCHFESCFFNYWGVYIYGIDADTKYPSYMVTLTTLVGLVLVRGMLADRIRPLVSWILTCLYSSKWVVLFITSKSAVWPYEVLMSAILPPVLAYMNRARAAPEMKPWQSCAHAVVVALTVWFSREIVFEVLQWLLGRPPSDGFFLGCCTVFIELACIPIVAVHFPHVLPAKGLQVLVVATVLFLSFLVALHHHHHHHQDYPRSYPKTLSELLFSHPNPPKEVIATLKCFGVLAILTGAWNTKR